MRRPGPTRTRRRARPEQRRRRRRTPRERRRSGATAYAAAPSTRSSAAAKAYSARFARDRRRRSRRLHRVHGAGREMIALVATCVSLASCVRQRWYHHALQSRVRPAPAVVAARRRRAEFATFEALEAELRGYLGTLNATALAGPPYPLKYTELQRAGRVDLVEGCMKFGGDASVGERLGMPIPPPPPPPPPPPSLFPPDQRAEKGTAVSRVARGAARRAARAGERGRARRRGRAQGRARGGLQRRPGAPAARRSGRWRRRRGGGRRRL